MKSSSLKTGFVLAGAILFNIVFWQEKLALNSLFFDAFILPALFYLYPGTFRKPVMKWLLLSHLVTLATVIIHNTLLSKLAFSSTLLLVMVFTQYEHRSLWYAAASAFMNYLLMVPNFFAGVRETRQGKVNLYAARKSIRFIVIPVIMVIVFTILYSFSNVIFSEMLASVGTALQHFFNRFFDWFSWSRFVFLLLGLFITGGLLLKSSADNFSTIDIAKKDTLDREKNHLRKWKQTALYDVLKLLMGRFANGILALKNENAVGIISLLMLNLLLFCINWLDVVYVWFNTPYNLPVGFAEYVHEGAWLLIFSILLAMLVLLFFFRGNLNFYKKNKWLKRGAYCWILQNSILVISVFFRNYYYIHQHGLAYKRVGLLVFLTLVLSGLITVYIKISRVKTTYFLLKVNAWVVLIIMVLSSCVHWDETIARYNLARKNSITLDIKFLLSLSDKALPVLEQNQDVLEKKQAGNEAAAEGDYYYRSRMSAKEYFQVRKRSFFEEQKKYSWLSWNAADSYVKKNLPQTNAVIAVNSK